MTESGALIGIEMMAGKLVAGHLTDGMDEIAAVKVFKPILIRVVGVRAIEEVHRGRIFPTLITSVLRNIQYMCNDELRGTYTVALFIKHERGNGPTSVGAGTGLAMDMNSSTAPPVLILGTGDSMSRHWHDEVSEVSDGEWR